jgi:chromosome segregation ATPase
MKSFEDLQAFLQDVQQRKMDLNDQKNALIGQREKLREQWEDAVFAGEGVQEAKAAMANLEKQIDDLSDHIRIMEKKVKTSSKVRQLAQAVWNDCNHAVQGVENNYKSQLEKTKKARDSFLYELSVLGEVHRVADKYAFYASEACVYLPNRVHVGLKKPAFQEVTLDENLVKSTYKQGRKQQ